MADPLKPSLPFEEAADHRTVTLTGWVCKTCGRFYEKEERLARYCCAKDLPCETKGCAGRAQKPYTVCNECRKKKEQERWLALPEVDWDGVTPLSLKYGDEYFFDSDDLDSYLDANELKVEDLCVVVCVKDKKPRFDMMEFLADYIPEGTDCDEDPNAIEKAVNDWIDQNAPVSWFPGKTRPSIKSLKDALGPGDSA